jgi:preprotein translocase subunit YajC
MGSLISDAHAQGASSAGGIPFDLLFIVLIFVAFYFLLIRPQQKRAKDHRKMVEALSKGDEVVTSGGLLGKITDIGDSFITVEISRGIEVRVQRSSVSTLMPKGTIKSA